MNGFLRYTFAQLLFLVFLRTGPTAFAQDYIIDVNGRVVHGKVTEPFIRRKGEFTPIDRINFRAEGERAAKSCNPTQIQGYYPDKLGIFHAAKFYVPQEAYIFFPDYTPDEDLARFESATGMEVKSSGKIKLYKAVSSAYHHYGTGIGGMASTQTVSYFVEKGGKLLLISPGSWAQQQEKKLLLPFIQDDPALAERWMYGENKLTGEFIEECVSRYNGTYAAGPADEKAAGETRMNGF